MLRESKEVQAESQTKIVLEMEVDEEELAKMMLRSVRLTARRGNFELYREQKIEYSLTKEELALTKEVSRLKERLERAEATIKA